MISSISGNPDINNRAHLSIPSASAFGPQLVQTAKTSSKPLFFAYSDQPSTFTQRALTITPNKFHQQTVQKHYPPHSTSQNVVQHRWGADTHVWSSLGHPTLILPRRPQCRLRTTPGPTTHTDTDRANKEE
uniref:Ovule protein n=1 Tax=Mesocestoides corti TaxID=53468 RepID=A0A5K3FW22_MESCO